MTAHVTVQCPKCRLKRDVSLEESRRETAKDPLWLPWCGDCHFPMLAKSATVHPDRRHISSWDRRS